jgi:histidine triad (HIT) family protein
MTYDSQNIFAKILRGELPAERIHDDAHMIVIRDIYPRAPVHLLAIPKGDYTSFHDFAAKADPTIVAHFFATISKLADAHDIAQAGYRLIANHGQAAGQVVPHFHMHILAGKQFKEF